MLSKIKDSDLQQLIGNILRYGVYISLTLAIVGGSIYLIHHGNDQIGDRFKIFHEQDESMLNIIKDTLWSSIHLDGRSIAELGILCLLITPTIRVVCSLFGFILEKDNLYIVITLIVLAIIGLSILGGIG